MKGYMMLMVTAGICLAVSSLPVNKAKRSKLDSLMIELLQREVKMLKDEDDLDVLLRNNMLPPTTEEPTTMGLEEMETTTVDYGYVKRQHSNLEKRKVLATLIALLERHLGKGKRSSQTTEHPSSEEHDTTEFPNNEGTTDSFEESTTLGYMKREEDEEVNFKRILAILNNLKRGNGNNGGGGNGGNNNKGNNTPPPAPVIEPSPIPLSKKDSTLQEMEALLHKIEKDIQSLG